MAESYYRYHVFFCGNQRDAGKTCCNNYGASFWSDYMKRRIREKGLTGKGGIRINKTGCLGRCGDAPNIVIYPDGVWYKYYGKDDIDEIIEQHLEGGRVVERLKH